MNILDSDELSEDNEDKVILFSSMPELVAYAERAVIEDGISYIEAIIDYCGLKDIDVEEIASAIPPQLKDKIREQCCDLRLLKEGVSTSVKII